jgi:hypothetical protein
MATDSDRPRSARPDGNDLARYRGWERWTPRHWAWEFLRRNPDFQRACREAAREDEAARQLVAARFGLRRYKPFTEGFGGRGRRQPAFVAATPSIWSVIEDDLNADRVRRIRLRPGQVLVRFDLAAASPYVAALDAQLRRATSLLQTRLGDLRARLNQVPDTRAPKTTVFIKCLRYLDLVAAGNSPTDAMRVIKGRRDIGSKERRETAAQAQTFIEDYVVIALMKSAQKGNVKAK